MCRVIAVCGILVVLFALGAFAQGYAEGYEDGKAAVMEVARTADYASLTGGHTSHDSDRAYGRNQGHARIVPRGLCDGVQRRRNDSGYAAKPRGNPSLDCQLACVFCIRDGLAMVTSCCDFMKSFLH